MLRISRLSAVIVTGAMASLLFVGCKGASTEASTPPPTTTTFPAANSYQPAPAPQPVYARQPVYTTRRAAPVYSSSNVQPVYVKRYHHRSVRNQALIIGGSAGTGAVIGALAGGKKGAAIGALSGGAAGVIYNQITKH
ncbi:MAG: hypothetical protein ACYC6M_14925 [Terriglobales bacterium]